MAYRYLSATLKNVVNINFWSLDLDWIYYDDKSTPNVFKLVNSNWTDLINNDDWRDLFDFCWGMRIHLWPGLIEANKMEVRFIHDGESLIHSLNQWDNFRDDGFNNFNSFRSTSKSGKKVLSTIKKWCRNNPDEGEEIHEYLFDE